MKPWCRSLVGLALLARAPLGMGYPLDGYEESGIRRVAAARLAVLGEIKGRHQPPGARLPLQYVDLRRLDQPDLDLPPPDPEFTAEVVKLLGDQRWRVTE